MKKTQMFLLHFAGGNFYSFDFLRPLLPDFELTPLELPGRGNRLKETLIRDFELATQDLYDQLIQKIKPGNFLIYGHSMGAYLALKISHKLELAGRPPAYLFVSGNPGPGLDKDSGAKKRYLMEHDEFIRELNSLGGMPKELIENRELFNYFEPILRADFEIAEINKISDEISVDIPLFALMGDQEERKDKITNWKRFTRSSFLYEILEGDHFFIYPQASKIATIIKEHSKILQRTLF